MEEIRTAGLFSHFILTLIHAWLAIDTIAWMEQTKVESHHDNHVFIFFRIGKDRRDKRHISRNYEK